MNDIQIIQKRGKRLNIEKTRGTKWVKHKTVIELVLES